MARAAVLADDTAYGQGLAAAVRSAARSVGLATDTTLGTTAVAFLAMGEVEQAVLMRRLRDADYGGAFISAEGGPDAPIAALAGNAAEGSWLLYAGTPVTARSVYAAEAADAARILLGAGAAGAEAIRDGTFDGETGRISFTPAGERDGIGVSRYRVVDGTVLLVS